MEPAVRSPAPTPNGRSALGLLDHTPDTLRALLAAWEEPAYRATQILEWVFERRAKSYADMSNLPKGLRTRLADELPLYQSEIASRQQSADGTIKLLLRWADGATSECVLIPDEDRRTTCISTQVGCPVGCVFCASGLGGLQRQLSAGQIVEQALRIRDEVEADGRLTNVVFMGLGEPLANYDATVHALRTINAPWGLGVGARKITVSTVGLPKMMQRLADEKLQITLALSLHAPNDELRRQIIPWAERVSIESLVEACNYFFKTTGREVTLEYILLGGLNDGEAHARQLAEVARQIRSNVNLLQYNPVEGLPYARPSERAAGRFLSTLRNLGINAHLRRSRGLDIDAACGQLRRRESVRLEGHTQLSVP